MSFWDFNSSESNNDYNSRFNDVNNNDSKPAYSPLTYRMPNYNMAKWAHSLGIIALATSPCILPSLILGPVAVILGILSRGGQDVYPKRAKIGIILGAVGFICGAGCFAYEYYALIQQYGSMEGIMEEYVRLLNASGV